MDPLTVGTLIVGVLASPSGGEDVPANCCLKSEICSSVQGRTFAAQPETQS